MDTSLRQLIRQLTVVGLIIALLITALPMEAQAASRRKTAKKYTVKIHNASSNTVLKKGSKLKLQCTAIAKDGSRRKIKYKSSNRRVIRVSKKGVIKAKRKGKARITAYVTYKGRVRGRKTITVRVGTRVSSMKLSGYNYLRAGKTSRIYAKVYPSKATNKKLTWKSSNPGVVSVDSKGVVTGKSNGQATITARAKDGSGVAKSIVVYSHKYTKGETKWIAHRGLHEKATENTAAAFEAAGKAGFWGCECDIYETKHVQKPVLDENEEPVLDENGDPVTYDDFEIVIDHDGNFKRVFGINKEPSDLTADEIRSNSKLNKVCFFDEYIRICKQYDMVPIVEIKSLSQTGIEKMADMIYDAGLMEGTQFISFSSSLLENTQNYVSEKYGKDPYVGYLLSGSSVSAGIEKAHNLGFDGVNLQYETLTETVNNNCRNYGLRVCTWTYRNNSGSYHWLYKHVVSGKYEVDSITTDGKFF